MTTDNPNGPETRWVDVPFGTARRERELGYTRAVTLPNSSVVIAACKGVGEADRIIADHAAAHLAGRLAEALRIELAHGRGCMSSPPVQTLDGCDCYYHRHHRLLAEFERTKEADNAG